MEEALAAAVSALRQSLSSYSLGEVFVLEVAAFRFAGAVFRPLGRVLPEQLVHAAREGDEQQEDEEEEFHDVHHHPAQRDLQRAQVRVDGEDVDQLQLAEDVGGREQRLGDEVRIERIPFDARVKLGVRIEDHLLLNLKVKEGNVRKD